MTSDFRNSPYCIRDLKCYVAAGTAFLSVLHHGVYDTHFSQLIIIMGTLYEAHMAACVHAYCEVFFCCYMLKHALIDTTDISYIDRAQTCGHSHG